MVEHRIIRTEYGENLSRKKLKTEEGNDRNCTAVSDSQQIGFSHPAVLLISIVIAIDQLTAQGNACDTGHEYDYDFANGTCGCERDFTPINGKSAIIAKQIAF